ncbi:MAG: hypothetical protein PHS80_07195, partial [Methanothrix sp.]|nr:hypothetical protein [Methanothrix sp.]
VLELWFVAILMAVIGSTSEQLNSGMMYIHRFSVWMIPLLVLIVIYSMRYYPKVKVSSLLLIGFIISAGITSSLLIDYDYSNHLRFNSLANVIIIDTPWAYNPPPEVFVERTVGVDGANPDDYLPIIITYNNRPRKIFTDREHEGEIDQWIRTKGLGSNTINRLDDRFLYINFDNSFEDLIPASTNVSAIYHSHRNDIINTNISMFGFGGNWYSLEGWDGIPTRWISEDASLCFVCQEKKNASLSLQAISYMIPGVLNVELNDKVLEELTIGTGEFFPVNVSIVLEKGINTIHFKVPQECNRPCDTPGIISGDGRCLSVAIRNISLNEIK